MSTFKLFSGSANPEFAKKVGDYLGMNVSDAKLNKFSDGEISVQITESVEVKMFILFNQLALLQMTI